MPWKHEWVPPEVAFYIHTPDDEDIPVFHAYKDNDYCERLCYWYTLYDGHPANHPPHISGTDHTVFEFDIRSFPTYDESMDHQDIMQSAYDTNLCTIEDVFLCVEKAHRGTNAEQ